MEKKLTKKEIKELEINTKRKINARNAVISALKNYYEDIAATKRYYKINNISDKLTYDGDLLDGEKEKLLRNYKCLDFVKFTYDKDDPESRMWWVLGAMMNTYDEFMKNFFTNDQQLIVDFKKYHTEGLWVDDIIWDETSMKLYIKMAKKFGYNYLLYTNSSSGALENITSLVKLGAKVVDTCTTIYKKNPQGLVFDISEINLEEAE